MKDNYLRHLFVASVVVLGALLGSAPTTAYADESPTYGNFAIKVGTYYPEIDKEFKGATPFKDFFGSNSLWIFELQVGAYLWQGIGKLGVGFHASYASAEGEAKVASGGGGMQGGTTTSSKKAPGTTSFTVFPLYLSLDYSFDYLATEYNIPLALNLDAGVVYAPWYIDGTNGKVATFNGKSGRGGVWGWRGTVGLAFLLNVIDENTAALFDLSWGVNRSYLMAEFVYERLDNFGQKKSLNLSDAYFQFGLKLDF